MPALSFVDHLAGAAGDADLAAISEGLVADPRGLSRLRVDMGDIGNVDRQLLVDDAAGIAHARLGMPARDMNALHDQPPVGRQNPQHLARLALVAAADDDDGVALLDLHLRHGSENLWGQGDDLHEPPRPQFACDRPEDARSDRLALGGDQHRRIAVETNGAAVRPPDLFGGTHDDGAMHIALLDPAARDRFLDRDDDDVADAGGAALRAAQHLDALDPARARIIRDVEIGLHLDHRAPPASSPAGAGAAAGRRPETASPGPDSTIQRLRFDSGRLSSIRT